MTRTRILVVLLALLLLGAVIVVPMFMKHDNTASAQSPDVLPPPVVQGVAANRRTLTATVRLAGTLKSGSQSTLSPKLGGKVVAVGVRAGQAVRRGQLLVRLDASDTQRQVEQAAGGVSAARAQWLKAQDGLRLKRLDIERRIREAKQGLETARLGLKKAQAGIRLQTSATSADVERAEAGLAAAKSGLARAKAGGTPEQREQARILLRQAERGEATAKKALDDAQFLFDKGGLPRIKLDEAKDGYGKAVDGVAQARLGLRQAEAGATPEEVATAEAQVRSAEAGLKAARAAANRGEVDEADIAQARAGVKQAEDGVKTAEASRAELDVSAADVAGARGLLDQALAAQRLAAQQLDGARVVSPVNGTVTQVNTHVGEIAGPGQPLVVVVGSGDVYLDAAVPSRMVDSLSVGQSAVVTVDAQRGQVYSGSVRSVSSVAGADGRSFPVEVEINAPSGALKAGGLARAEVKAITFSDAVTVPVEALRSSGTKTTLWVYRAGKIAEIEVRVPTQDGKWAVIEGGVRSGETVILGGTSGVSPGDAVEVRKGG